MGQWTLDAGIRWDHYQLVLNQNAVSPRIALSRYLPSAGLILHASYARLFVPPSSNNLLLSSSPAVESLNPNVFRLPVRPSLGNNYEGGLSKGLLGQLRVDLDVYRRTANNYPDYDPLLNTGVNFPIAFSRATIYGADGTLDLPHWAPSGAAR
jgi:outer membrane receptor protein involved in Fe transport